MFFFLQNMEKKYDLFVYCIPLTWLYLIVYKRYVYRYMLGVYYILEILELSYKKGK